MNDDSEAIKKRLEELMHDLVVEMGPRMFADQKFAEAIRLGINIIMLRDGKCDISIRADAAGRKRPDCDDLKPKKEECKGDCKDCGCDDKKDKPAPKQDKKPLNASLNEALNRLADEVINKKKPD